MKKLWNWLKIEFLEAKTLYENGENKHLARKLIKHFSFLVLTIAGVWLFIMGIVLFFRFLAAHFEVLVIAGTIICGIALHIKSRATVNNEIRIDPGPLENEALNNSYDVLRLGLNSVLQDIGQNIQLSKPTGLDVLDCTPRFLKREKIDVFRFKSRKSSEKIDTVMICDALRENFRQKLAAHLICVPSGISQIEYRGRFYPAIYVDSVTENSDTGEVFINLVLTSAAYLEQISQQSYQQQSGMGTSNKFGRF